MASIQTSDIWQRRHEDVSACENLANYLYFAEKSQNWVGFLTYLEVACGADELTTASSKLEPKIQRKGRRACE